MNRSHKDRIRPGLPHWLRLVACCALLAVLSACGGHPAHHARVQYNPSRYYKPPGPQSDPWGPYIREASGRFGVPELWIRGVMHQESGGQEDVISWAGAMGLMQVMPDTYDGLRDRYSLGDDPFDPHNNILAGTAYLREMYDRFGSPGFLAAYNAGPNRLDLYLNSGRPLPAETVNYVASIAPLLGPGTPMSGPLAVYAGQPAQFAARATPSGCDPDAAYNPNGPCTPLRSVAVQPAVLASAAPEPVVAAEYRSSACDPDAAYDPQHPCQPMPAEPRPAVAPPSTAPSTTTAQGECDPDAAYDPTRPCRPMPSAAPDLVPARVMAEVLAAPKMQVAEAPPARRFGDTSERRPLQERLAARVAFTPGASPGPLSGAQPGHWAIQVGAFANLTTAREAAENARSVAPGVLRMAKIELPATTPLGSQVAFRARLSGLSPAEATDACARLTGRGMACITVPPPHDAF